MSVDDRIIREYLHSLVNHPVSPEETETSDYTYPWTPALPFSGKLHTVELPKDPDRDFVILNLADIQCHDGEAFSEVGDFYEETVRKLIAKAKPDLITLTGDNAFDSFAYLKLIQFLDSFRIPWAPVLGNADHTGLVSEFWVEYQFAHAKHCLFQCGPEGMGHGNYILNITENGKPVHTLFMMDTHHEEEMQPGSYDHFYDSQLAWYRWAVEGIAREVGHTVPSSVFMHIPVPEYQDAWDNRPEENPHAFCQMHEANGAPKFNNGFFDLCKELGSTKNMLCGHDHVNCFSIPYQGITLTYAMKTGYGCYWEYKTHGGTTLTVNTQGDTAIAYHYIDPAESEIPEFLRWYHGIYLPGLNPDKRK